MIQTCVSNLPTPPLPGRPTHHGVALCRDRPEELWPRAGDVRIEMYTRRSDLEQLISPTSAVSISVKGRNFFSRAWRGDN